MLLSPLGTTASICPGLSSFLVMPRVVGQTCTLTSFLGNSSQIGECACIYKCKIQVLLLALKFERMRNWLCALS